MQYRCNEKHLQYEKKGGRGEAAAAAAGCKYGVSKNEARMRILRCCAIKPSLDKRQDRGGRSFFILYKSFQQVPPLDPHLLYTQHDS